MSLDIDFVRRQFPAFSNPKLQDRAFFENAGGSYTCKPVIDRLTRFYNERKVQPYGPYETAQLGGAEMDEARARLSAMMGIAPDELSFGPSTSANTYVLSQAFDDMLEEGDAIIVTNQDHEANTGAWRRLAARGIEVREWRIDPDSGHLDIENLAALLDGQVKLVCFPHCSNILGEINPVQEICEIVQNAGAVACVDGVSYAPHGIPDVGSLGADIYLFSAYKTYGPHQGIMAIKRALAERLPNQGHFFNAGSLYERFTPAGADHAQVAACAGIADYVDDLYAHHASDEAGPVARGQFVHDLMRAYEVELLQPLLDFLADRNSVRLMGPSDAAKRAPTVAVALPEAGELVSEKLGALGIDCWGGDFYSGRVLQGSGVDPDHGVLRMSFVHYTSKPEVDRLIEALEKVI